MVDFRRMIPVLAVIAFLLGSAVTASAQAPPNPLQCFANGGVSTPARSEDITALVGDLVVVCTGGVPTPFGGIVPSTNIQVFLNTSLTSRLLTTSSSGPQFSEALMLVDEPAPGNQFGCASPSAPSNTPTICNAFGNGSGNTTSAYYGGGTVGGNASGNCTSVPYIAVTGQPCSPGNNKNVFQAIQTTSNSVTFLGIPVDPPGTSGSRTFRITNVRGNANALGVAGANATPTPIVETISPTSPQFLPVSNPSQTVAFIQRGLVFSLQACTSSSSSGVCSLSGTVLASATLQQCDNSRALSTGANFNRALGFLRYSEQFATAFRQRFVTDNATPCSGGSAVSCASGGAGTGGEVPAAGNPQQDVLPNAPNFSPYNTESGFVDQALSLPSTNSSGIPGLADWGTRVKAVFNNIPNGVNIFVDTVSTTTGGPDVAQLTANETGAFSAVGGSGSNPNNTTAKPVAQLTVTNGSATAVWEDLLSDPNTFAQLNFGFYVSYTANPGSNSPALGTTTVNGSYAPTSTITIAANANVPRFADTSTATNIFTVVPCLTTLLFPYLTNAQGFDTGVAISATATDPFGTTPQSGTCTLNWYGAAFTGATPTPNIPSGTSYTTLVSTTLNNVTGGFTGYMIAVCRFQYAHGFAFISDLGARNLAMGYLALIIPDPTSSSAGRLATPGTCGGANDVSGPLAGCLSTGEALHE
jgi:hypothetical protein